MIDSLVLAGRRRVVLEETFGIRVKYLPQLVLFVFISIESLAAEVQIEKNHAERKNISLFAIVGDEKCGQHFWGVVLDCASAGVDNRVMSGAGQAKVENS